MGGYIKGERKDDFTKSFLDFKIFWQLHLLVLEIFPGTRAAWGLIGPQKGVREGYSEQGGHRNCGLGWPGNRTLANLQSDVCPALLAAPLSGITGNKVELMLIVYDTNSF